MAILRWRIKEKSTAKKAIKNKIHHLKPLNFKHLTPENNLKTKK
jgi:hypothetical protein